MISGVSAGCGGAADATGGEEGISLGCGGGCDGGGAPVLFTSVRGFSRGGLESRLGASAMSLRAAVGSHATMFTDLKATLW